MLILHHKKLLSPIAGPFFQRTSFLAAFLCFAVCVSAFAHGEDRYQHNVSTAVLGALTFGPNAAALKNRHISLLVRTDMPLTLENVKTSTVNALILGKYKTYKVNADLELDAKVQGGQLDAAMTIGQIEALLHEWEETYEALPFLKNHKQHTRQLTFHEGEGFHYACSLARDFNYLLTINIGYDPVANKLNDRMETLKEATRFIRALESDARSRSILSNNKSGLPVFVAVSEEDGKRVFQARHPMHEILWSRATGFHYYSYIDALSDVKDMPEVKRLLSDPKVKKFIADQSGEVRVNIKGNLKDGFSCVLVGSGLGENLTARLVNKKVVVEAAN